MVSDTGQVLRTEMSREKARAGLRVVLEFGGPTTSLAGLSRSPGHKPCSPCHFHVTKQRSPPPASAGPHLHVR